jgi:branched-chain amino acid transport system substrate-binding protein
MANRWSIRRREHGSRGVVRTLAAALALAFAVFSAPAPGRAADPFEIPAIMPITGPGAFGGKEQQKTLQALEDYVNRTGGIRGRPLKINFLDDQSSPQLALQLMNDLIAKHAPAVLGPSYAAECGAVLTAVKDGPVTYCNSPGIHPDPGSFMFSSGFSTIDLITVMVRYMRDRGLKRIAWISTTDASGQDGERNMDSVLADPRNKDFVIAAREHFAPPDLTVSAQISRIKAAAPQAVVIWTSGSPFGTFVRGAHEGGLDLPIFTTPGSQTHEQMTQYADFLPKELLFSTGPYSAPDQITDRTTRTSVDALYDSLARLGARPGFPGQATWDPGMLVVSAFRKLGTDATASQVRTYIATLRGWMGENGRYDFVAVPQRGLNGASPVIVRWNAAKDNWVAVSKLGGEPVK